MYTASKNSTRVALVPRESRGPGGLSSTHLPRGPPTASPSQRVRLVMEESREGPVTATVNGLPRISRPSKCVSCKEGELVRLVVEETIPQETIIQIQAPKIVD